MANVKENIKKAAEAVSLLTPFGGLVQGAKLAGRVSCKKKGRKWVKGKCVMGPSKMQRGAPSKAAMDRLTGTRTGRKKHPGTGDWYPEKG